jgi:hypothetical protein
MTMSRRWGRVMMVWALLLWAGAACAAESAAPSAAPPAPTAATRPAGRLNLGAGLRLTIPAYAGFDSVEDVPLLEDLLSKFVPGDALLLQAFIEHADLVRYDDDGVVQLRRYAMVQIPKQTFGVLATAEDFAAVRDGFRTVISTPEDKAEISRRATELAKKASQDCKGPCELDVGLQVGEQVWTELREDGDNLFSATLIARVEANGAPTQMAASCSVLRVKGKVLTLYVYSRLEALEDLQWAQATGVAWAKVLQEANR